MKPVDLRNATWESIQDRIAGLRLAVLSAWRAHGPGTTRDVSARSGIDILTFRPRSTELFQLGFLKLVGQLDGEGLYEALPDDQVRELFERDREAAIAGHQPELNLR